MIQTATLHDTNSAKTTQSNPNSVSSFHISALFAQLHSLLYLFGSISSAKTNLNNPYSKNEKEAERKKEKMCSIES